VVYVHLNVVMYIHNIASVLIQSSVMVLRIYVSRQRMTLTVLSHYAQVIPNLHTNFKQVYIQGKTFRVT